MKIKMEPLGTLDNVLEIENEKDISIIADILDVYLDKICDETLPRNYYELICLAAFALTETRKNHPKIKIEKLFSDIAKKALKSKAFDN